MEHLPILNKPKVYIAPNYYSTPKSEISLPQLSPPNRIVKRHSSNLGRTFNFPKAFYHQSPNHNHKDSTNMNSPIRITKMAKEIEKIKVIQREISKEKTVKELYDLYGAQFSPREIHDSTEDQLITKALRKNMILKEKKAAVLIQKS